uniref:Uncharacterized protein n=1 Tax=Arundo donax TaxID=35708 RepID=A0A0A9ETU0_ARUDO
MGPFEYYWTSVWSLKQLLVSPLNENSGFHTNLKYNVFHMLLSGLSHHCLVGCILIEIAHLPFALLWWCMPLEDLNSHAVPQKDLQFCSLNNGSHKKRAPWKMALSLN